MWNELEIGAILGVLQGEYSKGLNNKGRIRKVNVSIKYGYKHSALVYESD